MENHVYLYAGGSGVMELFLLITGGMLAGGALLTIIGITIQDIRQARLDKMIEDQPHTTLLRRRPLVSILVDDELTDESIRSIRHGNYRKIEIVYQGEETHGDLMLPINPDTILERTALSRAINQFNLNPKTEAVEILPRPEMPDNIGELLTFYRQIAAAPFIAVRAAFHVVPIWGSGWPVIVNLHTRISFWRARTYAFFRWLMYVSNAAVLLYALYSAVVLHQLELLLLYLGIFTIWLVTAIWMYPYFSFRQKIVSLVLAPVSLGYFTILALVSPFTSLRSSTRDAFARLWRSSHQH